MKTTKEEGEHGAKSCEACNGCQHQNLRTEGSGNWCWLFDDEPNKLPCAQHDQFQLARDATQAMIKKNPEWLTFLVMSMQDDPDFPA